MPPPAPSASSSASPPWLEVLVSAFFWTLIFAIVGYALIRFVRDRLGLLDTPDGAEDTWRGRLLAWLRSLRTWWRNLGQGFQDRLTRRRASPDGEPPTRSILSRYFSLRRLSPQELVRYYYLSTARRATQTGQPRSPGQTPYEYQSSLNERVPDLEPDLTGLTDAFILARYSPQPVEKEDAEAVKPLWQRIKTALRRRRTEP